MKKIQYIAPQIQLTVLYQADGILLDGSVDAKGVLGAGEGSTNSNNIREADVKRNNYNVWEDDWSK